MDFEISEEIRRLKHSTRKLVRELWKHEVQLAEEGVVNPEVFKRLAELGYYGMTTPSKYGGLGLSCLETVLVLEELGCLPRCFLQELSLNNGLASLSIVLSGSEEQKQKYLPNLASGKFKGSLALTEPDAGSDLSAVSTTARLQDGRYHINGSKHFITNAHYADVVTVVAMTDKSQGPRSGLSVLLVDKGAPGMIVQRLQKTIMGPPYIHAALAFDDCTVSSNQLVGEPGSGFRIILRTLGRARLSLAAQVLGVVDRLLEMGIGYSKQRICFGRPIAENQAIQFMLADIATELYAARMMIQHAAWRVDQGKNAVLQASMCKLFTTEMGTRSCEKVLQIHGGMGVTTDLPIERMYRELRCYRIVDGTSEMQRRIIAGQLLNNKTA